VFATDSAARGIQVEEVAMVDHADPPSEHKAYLHRSGRTARAGAEGLVVTVATDDQMRDVRDLTRKAGVRPTTTRVHPTHPLLRELAPGDRVKQAPIAPVSEPARSPRQHPSKPRQAAPTKGRRPSSRRGGAAAFSSSSRLGSRGSR
jgi:superfamily II DNA/RNA helicase